MATPKTADDTNAQNTQYQRYDADDALSQHKATRDNDKPNVAPVLCVPRAVNILHHSAYKTGN